ncbi:MAG: MATE family efflux transporter [Saprospiraceae bacterium]|nr:MATE family efflux transporter [Saprospiraceae bacterium]
MLGSAAQNLIVLCDNIFLFHYSSLDFEASGLVGVFYLMIAAIGYGFSRGGQILIARRSGEHDYEGTGAAFQSLFIFEAALSVLMFCVLFWFGQPIFSLFVKNQEILQKCMEYLGPRSYGIFFSYLGVSLVAYYTGIARTNFIIYDTIVLIMVNIILNWIFIFGKFGIQPMGIKGAALASTLAEVVAFIVFIIYIFYDKINHKYKLWKFERLDFALISSTFFISTPIVFQSILGIGSWFLFFSYIENIGRQELAISNLLRNVYLILSIPSWGYAAGINTLVSNFIGNKKRQAVLPLIIKTAKLNLVTTIIISLPVILFPEFFLYPFFGTDDMMLIRDSKPYLWVVFGILIAFATGVVFINGLIGTGKTKQALWIQSVFTLLYIVYIVFMIKIYYFGLNLAWSVEIVYWLGILLMSFMYLKSNKWHFFKI